MLTSRNRIGEFDRLITFKEKVITDNDHNEDEVTGWEDIASDPEVPAKKDEKFGNEQFEADKNTEFRQTIWTIRYREDITIENRIIDDNGLIYEIRSIVETVRRRYLEIRSETSGIFFLETVGGFSSAFSAGFNI